MSNETPLPSTDSAGNPDRSPEDWLAVFAKLAKGERSALATLYDLAAADLYGLAVWRTGSAEDAADIVHDVFLGVAEQGERLARIRNPKAWLLTVAHRKAVDVTRRRARRRSAPLEGYPLLVASDADGDRALDSDRASQALAGLPEKQRDAVYLRHFADCSFSEIGAIVGVPTFTAASRYRSGIARLRNLLEGRP